MLILMYLNDKVFYMINYLTTYSFSFFKDSFRTHLFEKNRTFGQTTWVTLSVIEGCEIPFQTLIYAFDLSKCLAYNVKSNRKISILPLPPKKTICSKKCLALSLLLVVPLKVISLALKICLFVFSSEFRKMQGLLVEYHIHKRKKPIPFDATNGALGLPPEIWVSYEHLFSMQDLGRLTRVNKTFLGLTDAIWNHKAKRASGEQLKGKQYFKDLVCFIEGKHDKEFIKAMGGEEKMIHFPSITQNPTNIFSLNTHPQAKELFQQSSIIRNETFNIFEIHCQNVDTGKEGILSISLGNPKSGGGYRCEWEEKGLYSDSFVLDYPALQMLIEKKQSQWKSIQFSVNKNLKIVDPPHSPS